MPGDSPHNYGLLFSAALRAGFTHFIIESKPSNQGSRYVGPLLLDYIIIGSNVSRSQLVVDEQQKQLLTTTESVTSNTSVPSPAAGNHHHVTYSNDVR
jgi:hypothetical protein